MTRLRRTTDFARLVLAWFVLVLATAAAAPLLQDDGLHQVCTSAGAVQLVAAPPGSEGHVAAGHKLDCPLCIALVAPPPVLRTPFAPPPVSVASLPPARDGHVPRLAAAPPPSRGPPAIS
jgi:hypothetical protein